MSWIKLDAGSTVEDCDSDDCLGWPTHRLEVDGVGSNYCTPCRAKIETLGLVPCDVCGLPVDPTADACRHCG